MPKEYELDVFQVRGIILSLSAVASVADALVRGWSESEAEADIRYNADREAMLAYLQSVFPGDENGHVRMTNSEARERIARVLKSCIAKLEKCQ